MSKILATILFSTIVFTVASCDIIRTITGIDQATNQNSQLWSDVPPMNDMKSQVEMPIWLKFIVRSVLSEMMKEGNWDMYFATVNKDLKDVVNFYSAERMASYGWKSPSSEPCRNISTDTGGVTLCSFAKTDKDIGLMIIATTDAQTKETSIVFYRCEGCHVEQSEKSN